MCSSDLDKTDLAQFPTSSSAVGFEDPREGAPRTLGRQKVPRGLRLRKYPLILGPSEFAAQAQFSTGAQGQNQGLAWSSDSSLWGNQVQKVKNHKFWTEPRPCMVLGLKPMGKPSTKILIFTSSGQNQGLVWSSDSSLWGNQVQKF